MRQKTNRQAGLTLIEVLVVLLIVAGVASLVGPKVFGQLEKSKVKTTKTQMHLLATALDNYRMDVGRYPTSKEALDALVTQPVSTATWNGPYLKRTALPKDAWGLDFIYQTSENKLKSGPDFKLISLGADGQKGGEGTNADISNAY